ncbi:hypothetical protein JTB14_020260 [Gonioctena quinquepunctata]|nr:hypothetical protein JTB14_020260 [Gonioctena quinquepunctata]
MRLGQKASNILSYDVTRVRTTTNFSCSFRLFRTPVKFFKMANILNSILWLLVLIFISFWIAGICAGFYIIVHPLSVCIPPLSGLSDFLLTVVQFPHHCAQKMMSGESLC